LSRAGVDAAAIHGDRNQNQRQRALDAFTAGHPRVLVATDVAARGIHVDDVDLVVQFDPPNDHKDYLHRSGRTARAGASGMVIALAEPGQVRDLRRLHDAAGVAAASHEVTAGHHVVRQIAASGMPVPPAPPARPARPAPPARPVPSAARGEARPARRGNNSRGGDNSRHGDNSRRGGQGRRRPRVAAVRREGGARGTAQPGRRSQRPQRPQQPHGTRNAEMPA